MTSAVLRAFMGLPRWLVATAALLVVGFYAQRIWTVFVDTGLFRRIGFDWGLFYSQAAALAAGDIDALYRVDRLQPYLQTLTSFTRTPDVPLLQWPSPYPPLLAAVIAPLTTVPPPLAFALWTLFSLVAVGHLVWRISQQLPGVGRAPIAIVLLTTLPVLQTLVQGQPVLLLASAVAECVVALRSGAEFRAGAWLGVLALKPQYGLVLGLFLLWKRRWSAVAGATASVAVILAACALVAGPRSLVDYAAAVSSMGDFRDQYAAAAEMVNWRALIVNARPSIGNTSGVVLFTLLALLTVAAIAWFSRGPWQSESVTSQLGLIAVIIGTMLVSYHSHMHGLVLLALPLAMLWRLSHDAPGVRLAILAFVFVPTITFIAVTLLRHGLLIDYDEPLWVVWPVLNVALLVLLVGATLYRLRANTRSSTHAWVEPLPALSHAPNA